MRDEDIERLQGLSTTLKYDPYALWANDPTWIVRYSDYAEALAKAERVGVALADSTADDGAVEAAQEELGDGSLGVWQGLTTPTGTWAEQGKLLYDEILLPVVSQLFDEARPALATDEGSWAILGWWARLNRGYLRIGNAAMKELEAVGRGSDGPQRFENLERSLRDRIWSRGLESDRPPQAVAVPWLRRLTTAIDDALAPFREADVAFDDERPFAELLPPDVQVHYESRAAEMRALRASLIERGVGPLGITEYGLTDLEQQCLPHLRRRLDNGESMVITGPTSTGKTDIGFSAACYVIHQKRRAIILLPTKALVAQAASQWAEHFARFESTKEWRVVEASRDFPYNDERIAKGDWDLMVAIPEKVAGYLASGSSLMRQVGVVVIDELQYLSNRDRGPNIEALLTVLRARYPSVPVVALAAHLDEGSRAVIAAWIGADSGVGGVAATSIRPVPVRRVAFDRSNWAGYEPEGESKAGTWDLEKLSSPWKDRVPKSVAEHRHVVALCVQLLREASTETSDVPQSVLIFAESRIMTERIALAVQQAVDAEGFAPVPLVGNDPRTWRYGSELSDDRLAYWNAAVTHLPTLPATKHVLDGLRTGITYHSARLDPEHRRIIEEAYTERLIRVIVATGTLAVGVNLPADAVIVASMLTPVGGIKPDGTVLQRVLSGHEIAQRLGRCGRLGITTEGYAFVRTLAQSPDDDTELDSHTRTRLEDVARRRRPTSPSARRRWSLRRKSLATLTKPEQLAEVLWEEADVGEILESQINLQVFARLLLQDIAVRAPALTRAELEQRAAYVYSHTLLNVEGRPAPDIDEVVRRLETDELVGLVTDEARRITGLGRTIAVSNVPIENAPYIRRVAEAAVRGAGPWTIIQLAAQAPYVTRNNSWLEVRHRHTGVASALENAAWQIVRCFTQDEERAQLARALVDSSFVDQLGGHELLGAGREADQLRRGTREARYDGPTARLTAYLRTCIAYLWQAGWPMISIIQFVEKNTSVRVAGNVTGRLWAYPADIRQLGENISYIVNGASQMLRVGVADPRHLSLKNLAESLQVGVPYQVAPIMWIPEPRIHRERLATLLAQRTEPLRCNDMGEVLTLLNETPVDLEARLRRPHEAQRLADDEVEQILYAVEHQRRQRKGRLALPPDLRAERLPSRLTADGIVEYGEIADSLSPADRPSAQHVETMRFALGEFGLEVTDTSDPKVVTVQRQGIESRFTLVFAFEELSNDALAEMRGERRTVLAFEGTTTGAEFSLREEPTVGFSVMSPWVFLAALARIDLQWRSYTGAEPERELARRVLMFFEAALGPLDLSDIAVADTTAGLPPPPPLFE